MSATVGTSDATDGDYPRFVGSCPDCGTTEQVKYGDEFECQGCGRTDLTLDLRSLVKVGQVVRVHIENTAPIGGGTQFETVEVEELAHDEFAGTDDNWGDTIRVEKDGRSLHLQSGGKSGEVVKIERLDTADDGTPILPADSVIYAE